MSERVWLFAALLAMGAGWGLAGTLSKIATSTGHSALGLVAWQLVIGAGILGVVCVLTGRSVAFTPRQLGFCGIIALIGSVLPGIASFTAYSLLPAGLVSMLLSIIPMIAFPIALALGTEHFSWTRLMGLGLGLLGVSLIVVPDASLPERAMVAFIPLALIAPCLYALEGNVVARWGTAGLDPIQLLFGASCVGALMSVPPAWALGHWISPARVWSAAEFALVATAAIHAAVYSAYVWMVQRAGPLFTVQVSYLVTAFGVIWAMILLSERYSVWFWAALAVLLLGVLLVQPRSNR